MSLLNFKVSNIHKLPIPLCSRTKFFEYYIQVPLLFWYNRVVDTKRVKIDFT